MQKWYWYLSIWFFWLLIFSQCDSRNLNLSPFCNLSTTSLAMWQPSVRETYGILATTYINETTGPLRLKYPNRMGERELITSLSEVFSSSQRQLLSSPKMAFLAKYWHFWPIWSHARPKTNANKVPKWFSVVWVPKLLLTAIKIRIFGPKYAFLVILGQILPFFAHFVQCPTKNQCEQVA